MSERRAQSIRDRKERIFAAAQGIIARDGYDALTTRGLAEAAGLTVPTLYNLIGDKDTIVAAMAERGIDEVWDRLAFDQRATPLEMTDAIIDEAFAVLSSDPAFHRAAFIGLDRIGLAFAAHPDRDDTGARAANRSVEMAVLACRAAQRAGLLRGTIGSGELGEQMFAAYRAPLWDWVYEIIDAEEMLRRQRRGFYLILAADASDEFRDTLLTRLAETSAPSTQQEAA